MKRRNNKAARDIAKADGATFDGEIKDESSGRGKGATFRLQFPLYEYEAKKTQSVPEKINNRALQGVRILVVDDDNDSRKIVERVLKSYGAQVNGVESVSEALKANNDFEVIVCDLSMPEEDGFSLAHKIREGRTREKTDAKKGFRPSTRVTYWQIGRARTMEVMLLIFSYLPLSLSTAQ